MARWTRVLVGSGCLVVFPVVSVAGQADLPDRAARPPVMERLTVRAPDGTIVANVDGGASSTVIDPGLDRLLRTAGNHLTLTHNHPASTALSAADLGQLAKAGVAAIEAVGADGSVYRATAGPRYEPNRFEDVIYAAAEAEIRRQLRSALQATPHGDVDAHFAHLIAITLRKAQVIGYEATLAPDRQRGYDRNAVAFGRATEAAASAVHKVLHRNTSR